MPGQIAAIAVYTQFQHPPSTIVETALKQETESILEQVGLELEWRSLAGIHGNEVSEQLAVVTFKGFCESRGLPPAPFRSGGLGWTHITDGEILPFMDVDCDHIRGFIRAPLSQLGPVERDKALGRAVGRVMAHELVHILGRKSHHGSRAVDRPSYTVQELMTDHLTDGPECRVLEPADKRRRPVREATFTESTASAKRGQAKFVEKRCSTCHGARGEGTKRGPALRQPGRLTDVVELTTKLAIDGDAMCRRAEHLKMPTPSLNHGDVEDLLHFLNGMLD